MFITSTAQGVIRTRECITMLHKPDECYTRQSKRYSVLQGIAKCYKQRVLQSVRRYYKVLCIMLCSEETGVCQIPKSSGFSFLESIRGFSFLQHKKNGFNSWIQFFPAQKKWMQLVDSVCPSTEKMDSISGFSLPQHRKNGFS